jgi:hypothetical protein
MPLPISPALREAKSDSLTDLFNRDLEHCSDEDIEKIIIEQRAQVERLASAEGTKKVRAPRTIVNIQPMGTVKDLEI